MRGTSETIACILQSYNIRVAHKSLAPLRRLLTNFILRLRQTGGQTGSSIQDQMPHATARPGTLVKPAETISMRLTEHKRATRKGNFNNHKAEHHLQTTITFTGQINYTWSRLPISYNPLKRTFGNGSGKKLIAMIKELLANGGGESHWNDFPINLWRLWIQALKITLPSTLSLLPVTCHFYLLLSPKHVRLDNIERVACVEAQKRGGRWRKAWKGHIRGGRRRKEWQRGRRKKGKGKGEEKRERELLSLLSPFLSTPAMQAVRRRQTVQSE